MAVFDPGVESDFIAWLAGWAGWAGWHSSVGFAFPSQLICLLASDGAHMCAKRGSLALESLDLHGSTGQLHFSVGLEPDPDRMSIVT